MNLQCVLYRMLTFFSCRKIFSMRYILSKKFIGYGHYELTITDTSGNVKSVITGDTDLIYRLSSEDEKEREEATNEAIALTLTLK